MDFEPKPASCISNSSIILLACDIIWNLQSRKVMMKLGFSKLLLTAMLAGLVSCTRHYVCSCDATIRGKDTTVVILLETKHKWQAEDWCGEQELGMRTFDRNATCSLRWNSILVQKCHESARLSYFLRWWDSYGLLAIILIAQTGLKTRVKLMLIVAVIVLNARPQATRLPFMKWVS